MTDVADSSEEGSTYSEMGHLVALMSGPLVTPCLVLDGARRFWVTYPKGLRSPSSTVCAYTLKWNLFIECCSSHREDPRKCLIRAVLSFLQQVLERRLPPSTLKVYVAAVSANHDPVNGKTAGKHDLVIR